MTSSSTSRSIARSARISIPSTNTRWRCWALTMFLMPTGEPFWGGTYFPPEARWGRPGFPDVLRAISNAYKTEREKVANNAAALKQGLARLSAPQGGAGLSIEATDRIAGRLAREVDPVNGGIGDAPKFPQPGVFELLWRAFRRTRQEPLRHAVELTLAWQETGNGLYAMRVAETVDWISREMLTPEGGFSSSLDADSEHEEGKFYVWSEAEIDALLGERAPRFKAFYDVSAAGNWEGHTILNRLHHLELADPATEAELAACRAILFHAREERVHPGLDDKVLADWTGLMIAALANAATVFERPDWLDYAIDAFAFVAEQMSDGEGRLFHASRAGKKRHAAVLDDYANMSRAALALCEATGDAAYLARAEAWVAIADRHYWDATGGGYFFTADDTEALIARTKTAQDSPNPSGNGLLQRALQIVVRGRMGEDDTAALLHALSGASLPNKVLMVVPPEAALPEGHPAAGKGQIGGRATAYVCEGPVCSLPLTDPAALAADLAQRR